MVLPKSVRQDGHYAGRLLSISSVEDIPEEWRETPIEALIRSENFGEPIQERSGKPQLLIATCVEFRYALPIPRMYAYVIRRASGRLIGSEFSIAYILSQGVRHLALIGHNDCGMTKVDGKLPDMIDALVEQGWNRDRAEDYIYAQAARHKMADELDGLRREYVRLKRVFKKLIIAPMFVDLADTRLFIPTWYAGIDPRELDSPDLPDHVSDIDLITSVSN